MNVIKWHGVIGKLLIIFVSFARDQHDVARLRHFNGAGDRFGAVDNRFVVVGTKTLFHFGDDRGRIFLARIVGGDNRAVSMSIDHLSHERTFLPVAIAAATKDDNQTARLEFAQSFQYIEQSVGCMRVIDEDLKLPFGRNAFETTGDLRRFSTLRGKMSGRA